MRMRMLMSTNICADAYAFQHACVYSAAVGRIADTVRALRKARGLTQAAFGDLFVPDVDQSTVSRWEKGSMPEAVHLGQIAALAGITMEDLTGLSEAIAPPSPSPLSERASELVVRWIAHELDVGHRTTNEKAPQLARELVSVTQFLAQPEVRQNFPAIEDFFHERAPDAFPRRAQGN